MPIDRIPPHDLEAEKALLGLFLTDNSYLQPVSPAAYYQTAHRVIAKAIGELISKGQVADIITVTSFLNGIGQIEKAGGAAYIADLTNYAVNPKNREHYAKIITTNAAKREYICRTVEATAEAYTVPADIDELCSRLHAIANDLQPKSKRLRHVKDVASDVLKELEDLYGKGEEPGLSTGFLELDNFIRFHPGEQTIIAGRPGMGKTSFALNLTRAALFSGHRVLWSSLEMINERLVKRHLSSMSGINGTKFNTAKFKDSDWPKLSIALSKLVETNLWMDDSSGIGSGHIAAVANRISTEHGPLGLIVIDYAQIGKEDGNFGNQRHLEMSQLSLNTRELSKALRVPVILVSQLGRGVEERKPPIPRASDLKESGAFEQNADNILLLYREEFYLKEKTKPENRGCADVIIDKNRNGPTGKVKLAWNAETTDFRSLWRG